jgi:hypothetical protein
MTAKRINVTLTEAEITEADRQAKRLGLNRSALIGLRIMESAPKKRQGYIGKQRRRMSRYAKNTD